MNILEIALKVEEMEFLSENLMYLKFNQLFKIQFYFCYTFCQKKNNLAIITKGKNIKARQIFFYFHFV